MIQFKAITKKYPNITALSNINLEINDKEFLFLVGPSGAGKSTLLKLLIREERPTKGKVFLDDWDVVRLPSRKLPRLRQRVAMVFQDFKLLPKKTVFENVAFALEVLGRGESEIRKIVPYMLKLVGLKDQTSLFPRQLSGGEAQRTAIARSMVCEPEVLIADEPTGNLDQNNAWEIVQLLNQINDLGTTVIMATHNQEIVNTLQKRVVVLDEGRLIKDVENSKYLVS